jgi:hypothetical protein
MGIALAVVGAAVLIGGMIFVKRNEKRLMAEAKQDMERSAPDKTPSIQAA